MDDDLDLPRIRSISLGYLSFAGDERSANFPYKNTLTMRSHDIRK